MAKDLTQSDAQEDFARAFGDALFRYLQGRGLNQSQAAELLGLVNQNGNAKRSTLNSYFRDSLNGSRTEAGASVLYLACVKLRGFCFDYGGYRLRAVKLGAKQRETLDGQMSFSFHRQYGLADDAGNLDVKVKQPPGRIEILVSLDAKAS
jgi:hypothetical protein